jgi:hypothetical protein
MAAEIRSELSMSLLARLQKSLIRVGYINFGWPSFCTVCSCWYPLSRFINSLGEVIYNNKCFPHILLGYLVYSWYRKSQMNVSFPSFKDNELCPLHPLVCFSALWTCEFKYLIHFSQLQWSLFTSRSFLKVTPKSFRHDPNSFCFLAA